MKKQIKRLNLSKRTISNLNATELNNYVGGGQTNGDCAPTKGKTCNKWKTCSCGGTF